MNEKMVCMMLALLLTLLAGVPMAAHAEDTTHIYQPPVPDDNPLLLNVSVSNASPVLGDTVIWTIEPSGGEAPYSLFIGLNASFDNKPSSRIDEVKQEDIRKSTYIFPAERDGNYSILIAVFDNAGRDANYQWYFEIRDKEPTPTPLPTLPDLLTLGSDPFIYVGEALQLTSNLPIVQGQSMNTKIVKTDNQGRIKGIKAGTAKVYAAAMNRAGQRIIASIMVTVVPKLTKIEIHKGGTVPAGFEYQFKPKLTPSNARVKNLVWTSSNPLVASISDSGAFKALAPGSAIITVRTMNGKQAKCQVIVR